MLKANLSLDTTDYINFIFTDFSKTTAGTNYISTLKMLVRHLMERATHKLSQNEFLAVVEDLRKLDGVRRTLDMFKKQTEIHMLKNEDDTENVNLAILYTFYELCNE